MRYSFMKFIILVIYLFGMLSGELRCGWLDRKSEGWSCFESLNKKPPEKKEENKQVPKKQLSREDKLLQKLAKYKEDLDRAKKVAIVSLDDRDIYKFHAMKNQMLAHAISFEEKSRKIMYLNRELDLTNIKPVNQIGRSLQEKIRRKNITKLMQKLAKEWGFFYFYQSGCEVCKEYAPVIKGFAEKYGFEVMAISIDGQKIKEFPNSVVDQGQAQHLGVTHTPTVFFVNPNTDEKIAIYSIRSYSEIEDRIYFLLEKQREMLSKVNSDG